MRKIRLTAIAVTVILSMILVSACGKAPPEKKEDITPSPSAASGMVIQSGRLTAFCPDGWSVKKIKDTYSEDGENPDSIMLVKGDYYEAGFDSSYVRIDCSDEAFPDIKQYYDSTRYIALISNDRKWEGFSGELYGKEYEFLYFYDRKVQITIVFDGGSGYKDVDVREIVSGITFY